MTKIRWAKYNHQSMFHNAVDNTTPQYRQAYTMCGILLKGLLRGHTAGDDYQAYSGRGTATTCKRCLKAERARK